MPSLFSAANTAQQLHSAALGAGASVQSGVSGVHQQPWNTQLFGSKILKSLKRTPAEVATRGRDR